MIQTFDFSLESLEVLIDELSQSLSLFFVRTHVFVGYSLDILDGIASVHFLAFQVVLYATFGLADGTGTFTGNAAADLDGSESVQLAKSVLLPVHYITQYRHSTINPTMSLYLHFTSTFSVYSC